ncbi:MAG: hypothetical protein Kow0025_09480 [Thermodesulfovibrionales bacterium]
MDEASKSSSVRTIPLSQAVGAVLAHDITEIRPGNFKGPAFRRGHVVRESDICHLQRLGKENLFVLEIADGDMHEDEAAAALAGALAGEGTEPEGEPSEGRVNLAAARDGLLMVDTGALLAFNMLGSVMCATLHSGTVVRKGQVVAGTRAIPLVISRRTVERAVAAARGPGGRGTVEVLPMRKPRAGAVISGTEVFTGRVADAFAPVIREKIEAVGGRMVGVRYAPDDRGRIALAMRELMAAGADLLVVTGGMSVDPDDVTRLAIAEAGARDIVYGSPVLPGAMALVAHIGQGGGAVPVLGVPACALYGKTTAFDLVLPRVLAGQRVGRRELAALGHGGLCLRCDPCRFPVCPFGKGA